MKLLIIFILVAFILGGFVGGEITDRDFSITGAVIGGAGVFAIIFGLGWFFFEQDKKQKKTTVSPEMREVFDRMLGINSGSGRKAQNLINNSSLINKSYNREFIDLSIKVAVDFSSLLTCQIKTAFPKNFQLTDNKSHIYKNTFPYFIKSNEALGYIYGAHNYMAQHIGLWSYGEDKIIIEMESLYNNLWSKPSGEIILALSMLLITDNDFINGLKKGETDAMFFYAGAKKVIPSGLTRALSNTFSKDD